MGAKFSALCCAALATVVDGVVAPPRRSVTCSRSESWVAVAGLCNRFLAYYSEMPAMLLSDGSNEEVSNALGMYSMFATVSSLVAGFALTALSSTSLDEESYFKSRQGISPWVYDTLSGGPGKNMILLSGFTVAAAIVSTVVFLMLYTSLATINGGFQADSDFEEWLTVTDPLRTFAMILLFISLETLICAFFFLGILKCKSLSSYPALPVWLGIGWIAMAIMPISGCWLLFHHRRLKQNLIIKLRRLKEDNQAQVRELPRELQSTRI